MSLKKRLIFTLLFDSEYFMLSRNFRLQKVGDIEWLKSNYDFENISNNIDELIILDVSRSDKSIEKLSHVVETISDNCFVPIAAGGGIRAIEDVTKLLRSGADKVVLNSAVYSNLEIVRVISNTYGQQCLIWSIDFSKQNGRYKFYSENGTREQNETDILAILDQKIIGEVYLNSIDNDGTGRGLDTSILSSFEKVEDLSIILSGGIGNKNHFLDAYVNHQLNAVATAHLFNFIGDGLRITREFLLENNVDLAEW